MKRIPTAEEFMNSFPFGKKLSTQELMIEFAKLHLRAATLAYSRVINDRVSEKDLQSIAKEMMNNFYPESNIK